MGSIAIFAINKENKVFLNESLKAE